MPMLELSAGNGLAFNHAPPDADGASTFVCVNPLTGGQEMWIDGIGETLRDGGYGLLTYNLRGQAGSPNAEREIDEGTIVSDLVALMEHVRPSRPVYVGLSVGGLFAIKAHAVGGAARAERFVLVNTLRTHGPRTKWINDAVVRAAEIGGLDLLRDLYGPLLFNEEWQAANRGNFLTRDSYEPAAADDGSYLLLKAGAGVDWSVDWEGLDLPVLVVTGLEDRMFYDATSVADICRRLPDVRRVDLDGAGHMVPAERPASLARAIVEFERLA